MRCRRVPCSPALPVLLVACIFGTVVAQTDRVNDFEITLYGRVWHVTSYFVQDDLLRNGSEEEFLEPEGLAFRNGVLYASGDRESYESGSRLAVYSSSSGTSLLFSKFIQMPSVSPNWWGPEGLTFNTSGAGYGGGVNQVVTVEWDSAQAGIVDLTTGTVSSRSGIGAFEDITFLPSRNEFAVIAEPGGGTELRYYSASLADTGQGFTLAPTVNGIAAAGSAFASWFARTACPGEGLIAVAKANPGNGILVYDEAGTLIGPQQALPVEPKSRISLGGGFTMVLPAFDKVEAVAIDETNHRLFLGDEPNEMIHVLTLASPLADLDRNGFVNQTDLNIFLACQTGPGVTYDVAALPAGCTLRSDNNSRIASDIDQDLDVDSVDFAMLQRCWSDSLPARPDCVD